jgi:hypothetical protein
VRQRPIIGDQGQADGEEDQGADHEEAHAPLLQVRQLRFSLRPPLLPGSPRNGPPVVHGHCGVPLGPLNATRQAALLNKLLPRRLGEADGRWFCGADA